MHHSRRLGMVALATTIIAGFGACATPTTRHPLAPADLGVASTSSSIDVALAQPGAVNFTQIRLATWTGGRGTFLDRDDPRTAAVPQGFEEAEIYLYVLDHPTRGRFLIDAGVARGLEERLSPLVRKALADLDVRIARDTSEALTDQPTPAGVFLTHLHIDHVGGLIDIDPGVPAYVGSGEASERNRLNGLLGHPIDAILAGRPPLREWAFAPDPDGRFEGVIDIFGDGSVWALHVPGHSPGSTAYLVNAVDGPKLVTGDAAQIRVAWEQALPQPLPPPAKAQAERSAQQLRRLVADHPRMQVFLGHQRLD